MRLSPLVIALLVAPLVALPVASAIPPVCIVKTVGSEGGKAYAEVWLNCGIQWTVTTCPKDGFCTTVSSDDLPPLAAESAAAPSCSPLTHSPGHDTYLCHDVKGPAGCMVWQETRDWETGTTRNCIA